MLAKTRFAFEMMSLLSMVVIIKAAPLMFPLTLGGFTDDTYIQKMVVTADQKILIGAKTWDSSIIDTSTNSDGNFLAYFDYPSTKAYIWAKQYYLASGTLQGYTESMDVN
jgi:hypothetical protein